MNKLIFYVWLLASLSFVSCSENMFDAPGAEYDDTQTPILLAGQITQECVSRANDDGFADGDVMGVYIVDYNGNEPGTLMNSGNRGDNVRHTFDEAQYRWSSAYDLYWKDKHTRIDVYGYYPFGSPDKVNAYKFSVLPNQDKTYDDGTMGEYEASDFLWGKVGGVEPTTNVIRLPLSHRMANARVTLVEGAGFESGQWIDLRKQVLVANTKIDAVIDLSTGGVNLADDAATATIIPSQRGDEWRAIVVPQTVAAGTTLFNITIDGVPYRFSKTEDITYFAGKMNNFSIRVDKKEITGDYTLTLISESITPWENDLVSHDATSKEYVIVNSTPGGLQDAITAAGKDYAKVKNLKITGEIDSRDFYFMRDDMSALQALNLKDVKIKTGYDPIYGEPCEEDQIPSSALMKKATLTRIILPDNLKSIGKAAFEDCRALTGSLDIPEGVIDIQESAFWKCSSLSSLSLPSTLKCISADKNRLNEKNSGRSGAFAFCGFSCELIIPDNVEYIGSNCFMGSSGFYGNLRLPEKLKVIVDGAFHSCSGLTGSLVIPQEVTEIPFGTFAYCGFNGSLILHDGITSIGKDAFNGSKFRGVLNLPKQLTIIEENAFYDCDFSGELILPSSVVAIGACAFYNNSRLTGSLKFGDNLLSIGENAFGNCSWLEKLEFSANIDAIRDNAFENCFGINSIISKSEYPPYIKPNVFYGVPKDNLVLEVPELAVASYQTAIGWSEFKRIAAHHELVCRPSVACALSTEHKQTLIIDAEGDWEVESIPDWCQLSQNSGNKKNEITLTIKSSSASESREGDIVFKLKDKEYTHKCHVTQYGYEHGEDEILTLQKATKGNNGGINLVFLGDGYDAKEISEGQYLNDIKEGVEHFFSIEPYTTYRDYFNVYTAFPLSTESGVGSMNTIRYNRFNTTYTGGVGLRCDYDEVIDYVLNVPSVSWNNLDQTLVIIIPNSTDYGGICQMWESGFAIAFSPKSDYGYPLDSRGVMQHEAGGHGFGKLGDEYIYHNAFIDFCGCTCCGHVDEFNWAKSLGWYDNLELTGKMHEVGWSHLIFDPRYSDIVDIYEGGYMHNRGVFRSEQNSCMNNDIPYYSTISRESIVKRIKRYAGEEFDFEEFVTNDKRGASVTSRGCDYLSTGVSIRSYSMEPVIHKGSPLSSRNKSKKLLK